MSKNKTEQREVYKQDRNNALFHLKIPYFIGKKVRKITIHVGEEIVKKSYDSGYTIGDSIGENLKDIEIVVIDKSEQKRTEKKV